MGHLVTRQNPLKTAPCMIDYHSRTFTFPRPVLNHGRIVNPPIDPIPTSSDNVANLASIVASDNLSDDRRDKNSVFKYRPQLRIVFLQSLEYNVY